MTTRRRHRSFGLDLPVGTNPPVAGEWIITARLVYRIVEVRPVESKVWPNRWRLTLDYDGRRPAGHLSSPEWREWRRARGVRGTIGLTFTRAYRPGERPADHLGPVDA